MRIAVVILSLFTACSTAAAVRYTETFVQIDVDCAGLDLHKFSQVDGDISSKALQDAYNEVHATTDNGDRTLADVHFYPFSDGNNDNDKWLQQGRCSQGTHCGSGGCENCPPDDDAAYLSFASLSSSALEKWEALYREKLVPHFGAIGQCKLNMHPVETVEEVELDTVDVTATETFVQIDVECPGLDLHKFTQGDGEFSSAALQDAYNEVHATADNGDRTLTEVHFYPFSNGNNGKNKWLQQGGCSQGTHCGSGGCENCPPDDDSAYLSFASVSSSALEDWEALYHKKMVPRFGAIGQCKLNMHAVEAVEEVEPEIVDVTAPTETFVQIDVDCAGLDLHKFSEVDGEISSKALQDAYNEVHATTDNGDRTLTDVHFYPFSDGSNYNKQWLQQGGCSQGTHCGSGGCENCPPDDDSAYLSFASLSSSALEKWEAMYREKLVPHFGAIGQCKLNMHPVDTVEQVGEQVAQVKIDIDCPGLDLNKLSTIEADLSAKALAKSFNQVHSSNGQGDGHLSMVRFNRASVSTSNYLRASAQQGECQGGAYCASFICRDTASSFLSQFSTYASTAEEASAPTHRAWERLFHEFLLAETHVIFHSVDSCKISMAPVEGIAVEMQG